MSDRSNSAKKQKQFDFSRYKQRYIALKFVYLGWDYNGLVEQANCDDSIEANIFKALITTCLIESRDTCKYNRCGRTDKGVSSYGQVVNLAVRSNLIDETDPSNIGLFSPANYKVNTSQDLTTCKSEINYVETLNRVLPSHIRAIAWAQVREDFSSRFDCLGRSYSYIFPRGDLSIDQLNEAAAYLIGEHDFRNLCSFDLKNGVTNHRRTIYEAFVRPLQSISEQSGPYQFLEFVIRGTRNESPTLIRDLLDINTCPSRPNYNRASSLPLSLFNCEYDSQKMPNGWIYNHQTMLTVHKQLKQLWLRYKTKALMIERAMLDLRSSFCEVTDPETDATIASWRSFGLEFDTMNEKKYIPILKRPRDEKVECKLEALKAKNQKHTLSKNLDGNRSSGC